jgi:hypothetical protein
MSKREKLLAQILRGTSDESVSFDGLCNLLEHLGFQLRQKGSHHIFFKNGVIEIINLQRRGSVAKPYQVKQVRAILLKYRLAGDLNE